MAFTIPSDTHVAGDSGHTTDHNNIADVLSLVYASYSFFVGAYGAKGDGKVVPNGGAMSSGGNTLTASTSVFVPGDVGKYIVVNWAGASATTPLSTTIASYVSGTQVTLTANAGTTVTVSDFAFGSDDTAAIQSAIDAAMAYAAANQKYAEVLFDAKMYMLGAATLKQASPRFVNSQLNFGPVIATSVQKITIALRGFGGGPFAYWVQTVPQAPSGTVLFSTLYGLSTDATFGPPAIIGGPNPTQGYGTAGLFNNVEVIVDNLCVMAPHNPCIIAYDFRGMAEANVPKASAMAYATPTEMNATKPTNTLGVGLYMPGGGNNDSANVGIYSCEGFYYGLGCSEHLTAQRVGLIYNGVSIFIKMAGTSQHGLSILYASCEASAIILQTDGTSGSFPVFIGAMNCEVTGTRTIDDPNNCLYGYINWSGASGDTVPIVSGAKNLEIISRNQARGFVTAPSVPASTVAHTNAFWHHAAVTILGGTVTVITIDGSTIGGTLASGVATTVIVPSGKTIAMTYSVAPTWKWVLM